MASIRFAAKARKKAARFAAAASYCLWKTAGGRTETPQRVVYVQEEGEWVIQRVGRYLAAGMPAAGVPFAVADSPRFQRNALIHFGSVHAFARGVNRTDPSNRIVATVYHGDMGISKEFDETLGRLIAARDRVRHLVASTSIMRERLIRWGFAPEAVSLIPIGVELDAFKPMASPARAALRIELGIPEDAICIGSFQKDGKGWGEGLEPKLIKGPDLFVEAAARLARDRKVHCLLTGPARGYVKKGLEAAGVPYTHRLLGDYSEVARLYGCLDLYLVTSREEGGPMSIMESMASGVPLVTTRVGMAPDVVRNGENGMLAPVGDVDAIVAAARELLDSAALRGRCLAQAREDVKRLDWAHVAVAHAALYRKLMA
jgi:glycosyltransferase involved in cell wall biosynthesis